MFVVQVTKDDRILFAGLDTGRNLTDSYPLVTKGTFFHDPFGAGRVFFVRFGFIQHRSWIPEIKASGPIGTGGHAEAASDAAMIIHHHNPVFFPFKGRLCRTNPDTGRVFAMVAKDHKGHMFDLFIYKFIFFGREGIVVGRFPDPFDLIFPVPEIRNVMGAVTGVHAFGTVFLFGTLPHVYNHGPPFTLQTFPVGSILRCLKLTGQEQLKCSVTPKTQKRGESGNL
jgi:hypothetical protein